MNDYGRKPSFFERIKLFFTNLKRKFLQLNINKKLAIVQLSLYILLIFLDLIIRILEKTANVDTSIVALLRTASAIDWITLIIRLATMVIGVMQIIYGIRDRFNYAIVAGASALLQSIPILYLPFLAAIVAFALNIFILTIRD